MYVWGTELFHITSGGNFEDQRISVDIQIIPGVGCQIAFKVVFC